jgi:hypothetical protein
MAPGGVVKIGGGAAALLVAYFAVASFGSGVCSGRVASGVGAVNSAATLTSDRQRRSLTCYSSWASTSKAAARRNSVGGWEGRRRTSVRRLLSVFDRSAGLVLHSFAPVPFRESAKRWGRPCRGEHGGRRRELAGDQRVDRVELAAHRRAGGLVKDDAEPLEHLRHRRDHSAVGVGDDQLDARCAGSLLACIRAMAAAVAATTPLSFRRQLTTSQVRAVGRLGLEPRTYGLKVRCSAS